MVSILIKVIVSFPIIETKKQTEEDPSLKEDVPVIVVPEEASVVNETDNIEKNEEKTQEQTIEVAAVSSETPENPVPKTGWWSEGQ